MEAGGRFATRPRVCIQEAECRFATQPMPDRNERHKYTVAGGGDGVEADAIGLVLLRVDARGKDAVGLTLPVRQLA